MDSAGSDPTIAEVLRWGASRLETARVENPRLESRLLLAHALGCSSEHLIRDVHAIAGRSGFTDLVERRAAHEPLAYILGWREFWSLPFHVSPATLIPRPDSEAVVAAALAHHPDRPSRVLDLGTGTGCLLLAFLSERPGSFGVGVDRSESAARLALRNARDLALAGRSAFVCGDWGTSIEGQFDLIVSNPPYIETADLAGLAPEVAAHEPSAALDGGVSGLTAYRAIIAELPILLSPSGVAVLELGAGQGPAVASIAEQAGLRVNFEADLAGITRAIILRPSP
jgi:release factor glutamine methyltransferase